MALSSTEEDRVRMVLKHCETSGADPVIMMMRMGLLRSHDHVIKVRVDTMNAIADLFDEMSYTSLPHEASTSPRDMKRFLSQHLRDLAGRQTDGSEDQAEHGQSRRKGSKAKKAKTGDS